MLIFVQSELVPSQFCKKTMIKMKAKDFVENVLCKDQEFHNILKSHRYHSERTKER